MNFFSPTSVNNFNPGRLIRTYPLRIPAYPPTANKANLLRFTALLAGSFLTSLFLFFNSVIAQAPEPEPGFLAGQPESIITSPEPGLLFYLSGENGTTVDFAAGGQTLPNFIRGVSAIPDGAIGQGLQAEDDQLLSYWAPGNIYAQRGTLSFFWRSRYPLGPTEIPIFRVAYADHSSWDMKWLRIDYNGSGIDAFVTDIGLTRTRVSHFMDEFPGPDEWIHIALSWDETVGIRLYINGELVEESTVTGKVYDSGLDQFGPHSRLISPYQVQSAYNRQRGGDLDELRIYDRMLSDDNISALARGDIPRQIPDLQRDLSDRRWRDAWWTRHGWNRPNEAPPLLASGHTSVRKVEIHDAIDIKRWYWKANDGIRETTWPAAYNMSRLPGRFDYFVLPDWDAYSLSGQTIRFHMPEDEPWNHIEMWGKAWGQLTHESEHPYDHTFAVRSQQQVKSYHRLDESINGGVIRFDNALIEEPIGSFMAYQVGDESAPQGTARRSFSLQPAGSLASGISEISEEASLERIVSFILGRYPADERLMMLGLFDDANNPDAGNPDVNNRNEIGRPSTDQTTSNRGAIDQTSTNLTTSNRGAINRATGNQSRMETTIADTAAPSEHSMPFIHVLIPYEHVDDAGLDGILLELPALHVQPTHNGTIPVNIRVKDPLWEMRDLLDFSFSLEPGESYSLWLDTRDRILPEGRGLYVTLAGAGADFTPQALKGARLTMIYNREEAALAEHEPDRFTQMRDVHAHNTEENPRSPRFNNYNRFYADMEDLLRVSPDHWLGQAYRYWVSRDVSDRPEFDIPEAPDGVPEWAHLQIEYLRQLERIAMYFIDERQIRNGEFGGGLNDDGKFTFFFPGLAYSGVQPDKILESLLLHMEAYYDQERDPYDAPLKQRTLPMYTNGLATIQTDELHIYEEGTQVVGQLQLLDFADPLHFNRGMETAKRLLEDITQISPDGHRRFRSRYYSGTRIAKEDPWQWSVANSYIILHTAWMIGRHNGHPEIHRLFIELADGLLENYTDEGLYTETHFETGEYRGNPGMGAWFQAAAAQIFKVAHDFSGDEKYRKPIAEWLKQDWEFDENALEELYTERLKDRGVREYISTEGSIWIDRVPIRNTAWLQEHRLGGVAVQSASSSYPRHLASWEFQKPATYENLAVFIPPGESDRFDVIAYNLDPEHVVETNMSLWEIDPGQWRIRTVRNPDGSLPDEHFSDRGNLGGSIPADIHSGGTAVSEQQIYLERGVTIPVAFEPKGYTVIQLERIEPADTGYWERVDLGIGRRDVRIEDDQLQVRVHNLGAFDTPVTRLALMDETGRELISAPVPSLEAPLDLVPRWVDVELRVPSGIDVNKTYVELDPDEEIPMITRKNNRVSLIHAADRTYFRRKHLGW